MQGSGEDCHGGTGALGGAGELRSRVKGGKDS